MISEIGPEQSNFIEEEVQKIRFLQGLMDRPEAFLLTQNQLLYDRDLSFFNLEEHVNERGLPSNSDEFYLRDKSQRQQITDSLPRVLNIGSGAEASRKLDAINVDISIDGNPEVVADVQHLPFADGSFSVVRASHVLEHLPQENITSTLKEWRRVLHRSGELQIAVPDASVVFSEIIEGYTSKGVVAYSLNESTAPLAQIYGLGYENPGTDPRWAHKIIYSYSLLELFLKKAGFLRVAGRVQAEDLAFHNNVYDDSQNHYSLLVSAGNEKLPRAIDKPLAERQFRDKCSAFSELHAIKQSASFIIPVFNEEKNLPHFLAFLENSKNLLGINREFIFVVNGCTDNSEKIIHEYLDQSYLNLRVVSSQKGIIPALKAGIEERSFDGFVGKLDADTILHPHTLDLMHMFLAEEKGVKVTYAEPTPLDSQSGYNHAEHDPVLRSERLYFHGRTSLYRRSPFDELKDHEIPPELKAEDIFMSFFYSYFHGLSSIALTPHTLVYGRTVGSLDDLVAQVSRSKSEIERVYKSYPPFRIMGRLLEREIYPGEYHRIFEEANSLSSSNIDEWTRIGNTK